MLISSGSGTQALNSFIIRFVSCISTELISLLDVRQAVRLNKKNFFLIQNFLIK